MGLGIRIKEILKTRGFNYKRIVPNVWRLNQHLVFNHKTR